MIVVAGTSVVINLRRAGQAGLLRQLFREVVVPTVVVVEFARLTSSVPRFAGLTLPEGVCQQTPTAVPALLRSAIGLDAGKAAALALAVEIHADAVLLDERRGREAASQLGLRTIGILGLLLQAKSSVAKTPSYRAGMTECPPASARESPPLNSQPPHPPLPRPCSTHTALCCIRPGR